MRLRRAPAFKPSVALAGSAGRCHYQLDRYRLHRPSTYYYDLHLNCWDRSGHGPLTLESALAQSCNVYFCNVGYRTGIAAMNLYAKRLGLGVEDRH